MEVTNQEIPDSSRNRCESQSKDDPIEEPWMLEPDFIQQGGQADTVEDEPEPDVSELYDMVSCNHQQQYSGTVPVAWPVLSSSGKARK